MIIDSTKYSGLCSCGKEHIMETKAAIMESGILFKVDEYLEKYGISGKRCALYDENTYKATSDRHPAADYEIILCPDNLHATEKTVDKVLSQLPEDAKVVLAIGAGTIHDTARYVAHEKGITFIACPTAATVDGFCSTVAAMTWYGFKKTLPAVAPALVLADTDIIKEAPLELVVSGIGDIMAKYTALADWRISHIVTGEYLCETIYSIMKDAVKTVTDSLDGIKRREGAAYEAVTYALIMSGLAMQMMGNSRPASGAEHHVSHIIEMAPKGLISRFQAMHGEKAGVGTIVALNEYKRLAKLQDITPYLTDYEPLDRKTVSDVFGDNLTDSIMEENKNDCLSHVTPEMISSSWEDVRKVIDALPSGEDAANMLKDLGGRHSLADIGVSEVYLPVIHKYSPMVRNRLTLMRMKRMIKA